MLCQLQGWVNKVSTFVSGSDELFEEVDPERYDDY